MPTLGGVVIDAISTAGLGTCIVLPGLDLAFDLGVCPQLAIRQRTVLFTHAHIDHMGSVVQHCASRTLLGMKPARYGVPPEHIDGLRRLLDVWRGLDRSELPCELVELGVGGELSLKGGHFARAFRAPHTMPAQGYVVLQRSKRLLPEWVGRPGAEIAAARRRGETVTSAHEVPVVAFTGDTTVDVLDREPLLKQVKLLVMEVTFVDDQVSAAQARRRGHVHLDELVERLEDVSCEHILLTHLSARYGHGYAEQKVRARLPPGLRDRVSVLEHRLP